MCHKDVKREKSVKTRLIKWGVAVSSLVMLAAASGAGRKFS